MRMSRLWGKQDCTKKKQNNFTKTELNAFFFFKALHKQIILLKMWDFPPPLFRKKQFGCFLLAPHIAEVSKLLPWRMASSSQMPTL